MDCIYTRHEYLNTNDVYFTAALRLKNTGSESAKSGEDGTDDGEMDV